MCGCVGRPEEFGWRLGRGRGGCEGVWVYSGGGDGWGTGEEALCGLGPEGRDRGRERERGELGREGSGGVGL